MTTFGQLKPKLDDMVEVYLDQMQHLSPVKSTLSIHGTVIGIYTNQPGVFAWLIGWKPGEARPFFVHSMSSITMSIGHLAQHTSLTSHIANYDGAFWLTNTWECEPVSALQAASNAQASMVGAGKAYSVHRNISSAQPDLSGSIPLSVIEQGLSTFSLKRQEKPCRNSTCGRMNDIGVKKCWNCECESP